MERRKIVDQYKASLEAICIPPEALQLVKVIGEGKAFLLTVATYGVNHPQLNSPCV